MSLLDNFLKAGFSQSMSVMGSESLSFGGVSIPCIVDGVIHNREIVPGFRTSNDSAKVAITTDDAAKVPGLGDSGAVCQWRGKTWLAKPSTKGRVSWSLTLEAHTKRDGAS